MNEGGRRDSFAARFTRFGTSSPSTKPPSSFKASYSPTKRLQNGWSIIMHLLQRGLFPINQHNRIAMSLMSPLLQKRCLVSIQSFHHIAQFLNGVQGSIVSLIAFSFIVHDQTSGALVQYTDDHLV